MTKEDHPARKVALLSREYVQTKNREAWLNLYADDAIIESRILILKEKGIGVRLHEKLFGTTLLLLQTFVLT